ncbi:unnamed protein product, partial [marine sediment metagenome]
MRKLVFEAAGLSRKHTKALPSRAQMALNLAYAVIDSQTDYEFIQRFLALQTYLNGKGTNYWIIVRYIFKKRDKLFAYLKSAYLP